MYHDEHIAILNTLHRGHFFSLILSYADTANCPIADNEAWPALQTGLYITKANLETMAANPWA